MAESRAERVTVVGASSQIGRALLPRVASAGYLAYRIVRKDRGASLDVSLSSWMFITTLCLALYLAAVKWQQELNQSGTEGHKVLKKYSVSLVDRYA